MPRSAIKWYKMWINHYPESWSSTDLDLFYFFISNILSCRKIRPYKWLEENLKSDCKKLSDKDIEEYCNIYEHIKNFKNVTKSQTAEVILLDEVRKIELSRNK